jgi:Protein of unknown function (DUF1353)
MNTFTTPHFLTRTALAAGTIATAAQVQAHAAGLVQEPLDVQWQSTTASGRRNWMVLAAFDFDSQVLGRTVHVPVGFVTDFASVPRWLWSFLPPTGQYGKASLVHDYLYETPTFACTRHDADRTFLEGMQVLGVSWLVSHLMFVSVEGFGGGGFVARTP